MKNYNFYIFGNINTKYSQYPNDYTSTMFKTHSSKLNSKRLVIHRKDDLIYYIYILKIDESNKIGFCIVFNKSLSVFPKRFIPLFDNIINNKLIDSGRILNYNTNGDIEYCISSFDEEVPEYDRINRIISNELAVKKGQKYGLTELSTIYNGTHTTCTLDYSEATDSQILNLCKIHNSVIIDDNTANGVIGSSQQTIKELQKKLNEANLQISKLNKRVTTEERYQQRREDAEERREKIVNTLKDLGKILGIVALIGALGLLLYNSYFTTNNKDNTTTNHEKLDDPKLEPNVIDELAKQHNAESDRVDSVTNLQFTNSKKQTFQYTGPINSKKEPHGKGKGIYMINGVKATYDGEYSNGLRHGQGTYILGKLNRYEGSFKNDTYDKGKLTVTSDGTYFTGSFKKGEPYSGTWYKKSGKKISDVESTEKGSIENSTLEKQTPDASITINEPKQNKNNIEQKTQSEPKTSIKNKDDFIFAATEQQAEFPGGQAQMMKWLGNNIRYPELAQQNNIEGRVIVQFVVEKDGSISNATVVKGVDKELDREALRVVKKMPKWQPGKNNGVAVRSYFTLPVTFRLAD